MMQAAMLINEPAALLGLDPAAITLTGPADAVASRFRVTEAVTAAIAVAALAYRHYCASKGGRPPSIGLDTRDAVVSARSEAYLRIADVQPAVWDPLSGLARAGDGWMRLHTNYDHHRAALCRLLDIPPERPALEAALMRWSGLELEAALAAAGGIGVKLRTAGEWAATAQAQAISALPLFSLTRRGAGPEPRTQPRVLDLTRVIAGPVATRALGLFGADVLRVDRPDRPEQTYFADTGLAKRSALADLETSDPEPLLAPADVVVIGYRPGALGRLHAAIERHPHLVVVELCAWGWAGPWQGRRGFDSIVQAATGINIAEGTAERPGQLPLQALDHATGWLAAACAWHGLAERTRSGVSTRYRLSLAQTACWLGPPREALSTAVELTPVTQVLQSGYGRTVVAAPPFTVDGERPRWPQGAQLPGSSVLAWR